jgi:hypothetical protein
MSEVMMVLVVLVAVLFRSKEGAKAERRLSRAGGGSSACLLACLFLLAL